MVVLKYYFQLFSGNSFVSLILFSGKVRNTTDFGVFVDIGADRFALLHISDAKGRPIEWFRIGQSISVIISRLDMVRGRINVQLDLNPDAGLYKGQRFAGIQNH